VEEAAGAFDRFDEVEDEVGRLLPQGLLRRLEVEGEGDGGDLVAQLAQGGADGLDLRERVLFVGRSTLGHGTVQDHSLHRAGPRRLRVDSTMRSMSCT